MWELYQKHGTYKKVAQKLRRSPDTVSRYVREYEIAVATAGHILNGQAYINGTTQTVAQIQK